MTPLDASPAGNAREEAAAARTATPAIRLEKLEKRFGDVVAVDGVDLEIADGEFFSMLGPSGSGKTTTLRMIAGFELPTAGRILLHGNDVAEALLDLLQPNSTFCCDDQEHPPLT